MANIKDLKDTKDYLEQLKNAVAELVSMNDFNLTISVNGTPIDEFFQKLESLNPEDAVNALNSALENLSYNASFNNGAENDELTYNSVSRDEVSGADNFEGVVNKVVSEIKALITSNMYFSF